MKLHRTSYPKNINMVKMLVSLGVPVEEAFSLCQYTKAQAKRMIKMVKKELSLLELNKKLSAEEQDEEDNEVVVNISLDN